MVVQVKVEVVVMLKMPALPTVRELQPFWNAPLLLMVALVTVRSVAFSSEPSLVMSNPVRLKDVAAVRKMPPEFVVSVGRRVANDPAIDDAKRSFERLG